jgi:hypothetical protein
MERQQRLLEIAAAAQPGIDILNTPIINFLIWFEIESIFLIM